MYRPFLGDFMLCIHLEYAVTQRLSEGPLLHQFASRFTPLKSPRSRDSFFEKTVPHSGMKCSGNRHKSLLNGTYAALIPLCPRLCRILKYLVSLHTVFGIECVGDNFVVAHCLCRSCGSSVEHTASVPVAECAKPRNLQRKAVVQIPADWSASDCHANQCAVLLTANRKLVADNGFMVAVMLRDKCVCLPERHGDQC